MFVPNFERPIAKDRAIVATFLAFRKSRMDGIPEWAEYFLGVNIQNFSSASNRVFSL